MFSKPGLTGLSNTDLERILKAVHKGELIYPIDYRSLALAGLSYLQDRVGFLAGLDEAAVRAVVVAVLHERRKQ